MEPPVTKDVDSVEIEEVELVVVVVIVVVVQRERANGYLITPLEIVGGGT